MKSLKSCTKFKAKIEKKGNILHHYIYIINKHNVCKMVTKPKDTSREITPLQYIKILTTSLKTT